MEEGFDVVMCSDCEPKSVLNNYHVHRQDEALMLFTGDARDENTAVDYLT